MKIIKKLVKGELCLAVTFWVFGVLFSLILALIFLVSIFIVNVYNLPLSIRYTIIVSFYIIDEMITFLVLFGLFNILKNEKLTFWNVIAFVVWLCATVYSVYDDCCDILPLVIATLSP